MKSRIVKIIASCCAIAVFAFWWTGAGRLKHWVAAAIIRFEAAVTRQPLSKTASGAYDTTDCYLSSLQIPHPSEAVMKALADVPADDALIFITSNDDERSELTYRTIAYLGWPRPIGEARCKGPGAPPELLFQPRAEKTIKWLMFHRVAPPPDLRPTSVMIGPHLMLAPAPELKEWKSYCSQ
jgi:hypothetical protein